MGDAYRETKQLLEHPTRAAIVDVVKEQGPTRTKELRKEVRERTGQDTSYSNFRYHVRRLIKRGLLNRRDHRGRAWYYRPGQRFDSPAALSPSVRTVFDAIRDHEGITSSKLADVLDLARSTVHYHLVALEERGFIRSDRCNGKRRLYVHPLCKEVST